MEQTKEILEQLATLQNRVDFLEKKQAEMEARVEAVEMQQPKEFYTCNETAKILCYSLEGVQRILREGRLPSYKVGRHVLIKHKDIQEYIEKGLRNNKPVK